MWFGINSYKENFFNIFVHECGHWGKLPDDEELITLPHKTEDIEAVMNYYGSNKRKVGPSPDEYSNFFRGGSSPGYSREDGAYQVRKTNFEKKTKTN
jgi:hypothetical protein